MQLLLLDAVVGQILTKHLGNENLQRLLNEHVDRQFSPDYNAAACRQLTKDQPLRIVDWHEVHNLAVPNESDDIQYVWVCEADDSLLPLLHEMEIVSLTVVF